MRSARRALGVATGQASSCSPSWQYSAEISEDAPSATYVTSSGTDETGAQAGVGADGTTLGSDDNSGDDGSAGDDGSDDGGGDDGGGGGGDGGD
jgi:hypothetical protein